MDAQTETDRELLSAFWGHCTEDAWTEAFPLFRKVHSGGELDAIEREWIKANTEEQK